MGILIIVFLAGVITLFMGIFKQSLAKYVGILGLITALAISFLPEHSFWSSYQNMFWFDENTRLFTKISLFLTLLIFILGDFALYRHKNHQSEIYALVLFSLCGGLVLVGFQNITTLFLGIEILSIPLYVLAGSEKKNLFSVEASVKYFLMGAFATGFLLFGVALIYGSIGSLDLNTIGLLSMKKGNELIFNLGVFLMIGAMAFKIAMVPFHLWSPDVYYGSPTWVTLFMASVVKVVSFYAFFKLISIAFMGSEWQFVLWGLITLTLIFGSVLGLPQSDLKKLLAYSSIVNVGYLGLIFFRVNETSIHNLAFYLLVYGLSCIGVFLGLIWIEREKENSSLEAFNGLAKEQPLLALQIAVSVFSMVGIPFSAGFVGKLKLFLQAIEYEPVLVLISVIASVISVAYYLKIVIAMYWKREESPKSLLKFSWEYRFISFLILVLTIILGVFPILFFQLI